MGVSNQGRTRLSPDKVCIQYKLDYTQSVFFVCVSFEGGLCIATLRPGVGLKTTPFIPQNATCLTYYINGYSQTKNRFYSQNMHKLQKLLQQQCLT